MIMPNEEFMLDHEVALRKKKKNKIIALSLLGLVLALVVLIIVGACVPVNLKPYLIGSPSRVTIYNQSQIYGEFDDDQAKYSEFMEDFADVFETSYLVALFSGRLGDYKISGQSESLILSNVLSELKAGYYVEFKYENPQTLTYNDGTEYKSIYNGASLTFTSLYFAISQTDELVNLDMYVGVKYSDADNATTYALKVTQKANTYSLYDKLANYKTY